MNKFNIGDVITFSGTKYDMLLIIGYSKGVYRLSGMGIYPRVFTIARITLENSYVKIGNLNIKSHKLGAFYA